LGRSGSHFAMSALIGGLWDESRKEKVSVDSEKERVEVAGCLCISWVLWLAILLAGTGTTSQLELVTTSPISNLRRYTNKQLPVPLLHQADS
jgi:hypothetical protein